MPDPTDSADSLRRSISDDDTFSFLRPLLDGTCSSLTLHENLPDLARLFGEYQLTRIIPRRHKQGRRCLLEFALSVNGQAQSVLGKSRARGLDYRSYQVHSDLYNRLGAGGHGPREVQVPRTIGVAPRWHMWFQVRAPGSCGWEFAILVGQVEAARRIARALARLHSCPPILNQKHTTEKELDILSDGFDSIVPGLRQRACQLNEIFDECVRAAQTISKNRGSLIHRDFYPDQVLLTSSTTYLLDLDTVSIGDPNLDIGNYLAHLAEHNLRERGDFGNLGPAEHAMISEYSACSDQCNPRDVIIYKLLALARLIIVSRRIPCRRASSEALIDAVHRFARSIR